MQARKRIAEFLPWLCFGSVLMIQQYQLTQRGKWMRKIDEWQKQVEAQTIDRVYRAEMLVWIERLKQINETIKVPDLEHK